MARRERVLGQGAYGKIIERDGKAVKRVIKGEYSSAEINALTVLNHPNIIKPNKIEFVNGQVEITMKKCNLQKMYRKLTWEQKMLLVRQMLSALYHVHESGIIHLDICIHNIIGHKDENNQINFYLIDFGMSIPVWAVKDGIILYETRTTLDSRPPEGFHYKDGAVWNAASDIWSMGITLLSILGDRDIMPPTISRLKTTSLQEKRYFTFLENSFKKGPDRFVDKFLSRGRGSPNPVELASAKDLIKKMLQYRNQDRISFRKLLDHPLMKGTPLIKSDIPSTVNGSNIENCSLIPDIIEQIFNEWYYTLVFKEHSSKEYFLAIDILYRYASLKQKISEERLLKVSCVIISFVSDIYISETIDREEVEEYLKLRISEREWTNLSWDITSTLNYVIFRPYLFDTFKNKQEMRELSSLIYDTQQYLSFKPKPVATLDFNDPLLSYKYILPQQ